MATTRHQSADVDDLALAGAEFVHVVSRADGDGLAAAGILATALEAVGTPFQLSVATTVADRTARATAVDRDPDDVTVTIGDGGAAPRLDAAAETATQAAWALASELGTTPDPVLGLAGVVAAGGDPGDAPAILEAAESHIEQTPGLATPIDDPIEGIAHSHRCLAPWSGDPEAAASALGDPDDGRQCASLVAIDAVNAGTPHAATAIRRCLHPFAIQNGPFATVGGYAEVLEAVAHVDPGLGLELALGETGAADQALGAWQSVGRRVHEAIADPTSHDGLATLEVDGGPLRVIASVLLAYRVTEPTVLVVGPDRAAIAMRDGRCEAALEAIAASEGAYDVVGDETAGTATVDADTGTLVEQINEEVSS